MEVPKISSEKNFCLNLRQIVQVRARARFTRKDIAGG